MNVLLSKAINFYLDLDPESRERVKKLRGKIIAIEFKPLKLNFFAVFDEQGMRISTNKNLESDAKISGTPLQMLAVAIVKENRHAFFADDLRIEGDAEFAQQVIELFDHMNIDVEEYLAKILGDIPAYHASRTFSKFSTWLANAAESFTQNINEYVHEEAQWLPAREALQDLFIEIDTLRMDVDRVEAKLKNIEQLMEEKKL